MMADMDLSGYVEVPERIAEFREKHPEGCLRPVNPEQPYTLEVLSVGSEQKAFIVYTAAAYRSPDDPMPGIGCAWEPFPGRTPYTRDSELMNAETSAWGRAIVAVLAADAKRGIATAEEVRNRRAEQEQTGERPPVTGANPKSADKGEAIGSDAPIIRAIHGKKSALGMSDDTLRAAMKRDYGKEHAGDLTMPEAKELCDKMQDAIEKKEAREADAGTDAPTAEELAALPEVPF